MCVNSLDDFFLWLILNSLSFRSIIYGYLKLFSFKVKDLILLFKREKNSASEGEVTFYLNNKSNIFPVDSKIIEIKRRIKKTGQTQYKLNNRNVTRGRILELLSHAKVFPDAHNIILQGDIIKFCEMGGEDRRLLIEEISGISVYEDKKNKALSELQKVEEKLKEAEYYTILKQILEL